MTNAILQFDPIIALCTPRGSGAIALLRLCGRDAITIATNMSRLSSGKLLSEQSSHTIHHGFVIDQQSDIIDEVLFLLMHSPKTFTGEDTVEITAHNNQFIIDHIIKRAIELGARLAKPGEFTERAYLNKKMDLVQAEALAEVISAQSEQTLRIAQSQMRGSLSSYFGELEHDLITLLGLSEASFEFLDEEQRDLDFDALVREHIALIRKKIDTLTAQFSLQEHIRSGFRIALIGSVNVGKSTLFNALLEQDRAIVTDRAGTTRDSIEGSRYHKGHFLTYIDTAGIRITEDIIEQEGIARSHTEAARADIIILVIDRSMVFTPFEHQLLIDLVKQYESKIIVVENKEDLTITSCALIQEILAQHPALQDWYVSMSARTSGGLAHLRKLIDAKIDTLFSTLSSPFLLTKRQQALISELDKKLQTIESLCAHSIEYEIVAYHIQDILLELSQLTGKNVHEKMLDMVFRSFCIGK